MADGLYYNDLRAPFCFGDITAVTLTATDLALYPLQNFPVLGGNYFNYVGKKMKIRMFGRMTTGATPGNGTFDIYWGTGSSANGTIIGSSSAFALMSSQTNVSWTSELNIYCRTVGSGGTLMCTGWTMFNNGVVSSALQPVLIPATAAASSAAVDLTAANIVSVQFKRSGSTAETMQIHDMDVIAMN